MGEATLGVYIHIPFCERVCPYCDFAVVRAPNLERSGEDAYVDALLHELALRGAAFEGLELVTLYFGGGTPSLLHAQNVARLIEALRKAFPGEALGEVTLEVNPSTVERDRLPAFRAAGVDRLSIGIQSFDDRVLKRLGRAHRPQEGRETLQAAREASFSNLSLDLLYGVPDQSCDIYLRDLDEALGFEPEHVSAYELTVEAGTPYATGVARKQLRLPPEDELVRMMDEGQERLMDAGLPGYEISNYARPGFESRHNRRYWQRLPVLGLGVGAWSTEPRSRARPHGARRANVAELGAYLERVIVGETAAVGPDEILDPATAQAETMMLGLRTADGVDAVAFADEFGGPPRRFFGEALDELCRAQLVLEGDGGDLSLSPTGRRIADSVCERFF